MQCFESNLPVPRQWPAHWQAFAAPLYVALQGIFSTLRRPESEPVERLCAKSVNGRLLMQPEPGRQSRPGRDSTSAAFLSLGFRSSTAWHWQNFKTVPDRDRASERLTRD